MQYSMILVGMVAAVSAQSSYTLSTVYETSTSTVLSCAPTVTNCPVGHVVTKTIAVSTTLCPVAATETVIPPYPTNVPGGPHTLTKTILSTEIKTVSKCPATVVDCPYTTAPVVSTIVHTLTPGPYTSIKPTGDVSPPKPTGKPSGGDVSPPKPTGPILSTITISTCIPSYITSVITVTGTTPTKTPAAPVVPAPSTYPSGTVPKPAGNSTTPFTGAANAHKAGGLLMAVGIVAALL